MASYPTPEHEAAAERFVELFCGDASIVAILLSGSCARGKGTTDSDIDMTVIVNRGKHIKPIHDRFERVQGRIKEFKDLRKVGKYADVEANVISSGFKPIARTWTSGPDNFELEIGNTLVYSRVLLERGESLAGLRARYLPYYPEELRLARLAEVKKYLYNDLDHIPLYVDRGLYFAGFSRLYNASREFLQGLFISRRIYPIAYDKWVEEQLVGILGLPTLYHGFVDLMQIQKIEGDGLAHKSEKLRQMAARYLN